MASAKRLLFTKKAITGLLTVAALGLTASPALAHKHRSARSHSVLAALDLSGCTNPLLTQPFLSWGDSNYYTLMPGESVDSFNGTGWTLSGGASIVQTTLANGTTGNVLDIPGGGQAVSPVFCVQSNYPTARTMILGSSEGVFMNVSYAGTSTWNNPKNTGQVHSDHGWTLSDPVNIQPSNTSGWQLLRITLNQPNQGTDSKLYNFYVDPYAKR